MSVLKSVRETISDLFEALTPPTDATVTYRHLSQLAGQDSAVGRRQFYFTPPTGARETEFESSFTTLRTSFEVVVSMIVDGRRNEDLFDEIADEAILLLNTINLSPSGTFAAGVNFVQATGWRLEQTEDGLEIVLSIQAETEESDGA